MQPAFVETENIRKLHASIVALMKRRVAREVSFIVMEGAPGLGKSLTLRRIHSEFGRESVLLRAWPWWTKAGFLSDLAENIGTGAVRRSVDALFRAVCDELAQMERVIMIDEVQDIAARAEIVETIRAVSDRTGSVVVLAGGPGTKMLLQRHPQIDSRVALAISYGALDEDDIASLGEANTDDDISLGKGVAAVVTQLSRGVPRRALTLFAKAERAAREDGRAGNGGANTAVSPQGFARTIPRRPTWGATSVNNRRARARRVGR